MIWSNLGFAFVAALAGVSASPLEARRNTAEFKDQMIASHNFFRSQHSAEPLVWDEELAQKAQAWADTCNFRHASTGENLAYTTRFSHWGYFTNMWGIERLKYDYNNPGFSSATGHFTQVVWKQSTNLGCGWKRCHGGSGKANGYYVVCRYTPPGNYQGRFKKNVGRQISGKSTDIYQPEAPTGGQTGAK